MSPVCVFSLFGHDTMADRLAEKMGAERGAILHRRFPDGESLVRIDADVAGKDVIIVAALDRPDEKIPPLLFAADAAEEEGARSVGLVAPYLPYLRQDAQFATGEAVTSHSFARWISSSFDWLVTVDPHLHRIKDLSEVYGIPARNVTAAPAIASWIAENVPNPAIIGPDEESEQWVKPLAERIDAPYFVLHKTRKGDLDVAVVAKTALSIEGRTPVLVDDVISSGMTMVEAAKTLLSASGMAPVCAATHGIPGSGAEERLAAAGVARLVTTNTLPHAKAEIDVSDIVLEGVRSVLPRAKQ